MWHVCQRSGVLPSEICAIRLEDTMLIMRDKIPAFFIWLPFSSGFDSSSLRSKNFFQMRPIPQLISLIATFFCVAATFAQAAPVLSARKDAGGVTFQTESGALRLEVCADRIVRVVAAAGNSLPTNQSFVVTADWKPVSFKLDETKTNYAVHTKSLRLRVEKANGAVTFLNAAGSVLLAEKPDTRMLAPNGEFFVAEDAFVAPPDEFLYGLGQFQDGLWNWRGLPREFRQVNTTASLPMLISSRGYGLLWDNASITDFNPITNEIPLVSANDVVVTNAKSPRIATWNGRFTSGAAGEYVFFARVDDNRQEIALAIDGKELVGFRSYWTPFSLCGLKSLPANTACDVSVRGGTNATLFVGQRTDTTTFRSQLARAVDYTFFYGPELDDVIAGYRQATGDAPMWPKWAYGFWQCRERYSSQQELLDSAAGFRSRGLPIDLIVQDWKYWGSHGWGAHQWDTNAYPDPAGMIAQLHAENIKFMISVWCNPRGLARAELTNHNAVVDSWVDVFNPLGRDIRWKWLNSAFFSIGTDAWWGDATEPGDTGHSFEGRNTFLGPSDFFRNAYSLFASQSIYEGQRATDPNKRVVNLTRSAFPGLQRYAAGIWSGDIPGNWETLQRQIPAGLNFCLSGIPYWTTDCGGFFRPTDQYASPDFNELQARWFEWCTFHPILRMHGGATRTEMWEWLPETQKIMRAYDELRYRMLPYNYSVAWRVTSEGYTILRALPLDFRADANVLTISDEYMFGPAFLVAPVTEPQATSRKVYLPAGTSWMDFWTGERFDGGKIVDANAPLERIPLFVRAGSIVPLGSVMQYASEKPADPIELRVFPGADGAFALYEDEGDSYDYERGIRSTIPISWDEKKQTLTIGRRAGKFPGMLKQRTFRIVWVKPGVGAGAEHAEAATEVRYKGKAMKIRQHD
jgi:alpha-D-xyloside xylohydrolase